MTTESVGAFLAVSAVLGEPLDESLAFAGASAEPLAPELLRELRSGSRERRARAIAAAVVRVVLALDEMRLA